MKGTTNIGDIIRQIAKSDAEVYSVACRVVSIDSENFAELAPLDGSPNLLEVFLVAESDDTNFLITPAVDSIVIATFLSKNVAFISMFSKIETINIRGDQYGGLIKINELIGNLDKLTARVDGIIDAINNAVPVPSDGGAGLQATMKAKLLTLIDKEDFSGIENDKVKHG